MRSLTRHAGVYRVETEAGSFAARQVVVATGPFQVPFTPPLADQLDPELAQVHSATYRGPESLPPGRALVVGAANSGAQIALELSATRSVDISTGERLPTVPQRPLGRDVWWWGEKLGITRITVDSRLGRRMSGRDVVIGGGLRELRRHGVGVRGRVVAAAGRTVTFSDGESAEYDGIVWATGFRLDHSWIDVPGAKDEDGRVIHRRGVTPAPGLYVLGLTWQYKRTSALLGWVAEDAEFLAERIEAAKETTEQRERELAEVSE